MPVLSKHALVIVFDGIEEVEALTPVDILRRAAIKVTMASVTDSLDVTGRNGITFKADTRLSSLDHSQPYDLVLLPGGPGVLDLTENRQVANILKTQNAAKREIAAICAAPKILAIHGLLDDKAATGHISVRKDLPKPSNAPTVEDGNITTSQGVGTAVNFSLTLAKRLKGKEIAKQIADEIHCA